MALCMEIDSPVVKKITSSSKISQTYTMKNTEKEKPDMSYQTAYIFSNNINKFKKLPKFEKIKILTDYLNVLSTKHEKSSSEFFREEYNSLTDVLRYETDRRCVILMLKILKDFFDILNDWGIIKVVIDINTRNPNIFVEIFGFLYKIICSKKVSSLHDLNSQTGQSGALYLTMACETALLQLTESTKVLHVLAALNFFSLTRIITFCRDRGSEYDRIYKTFIPCLTHDRDERIRSLCINTIVSLKSDSYFIEDIQIFSIIYQMLEDNSEIVRVAVIPYLTYFAQELPEACELLEFDSLSRDKIFLSLCSVAICDLSYQVRIAALKHLNLFSYINETVLEKTVSRTLYVSYSNRKSYHHSQREKFSGIRDTKIDNGTPISTEIVYIRRCPDGVFIDCLEEEHWEVRVAAIQSLYELCVVYIKVENFRKNAIDLLIDSLTDSQEKVRFIALEKLIKLLKLIQTLSDSSNIKSSEFEQNSPLFEICDYQLDAIIGALSDANHEFRKGLHKILSISYFVTAISLFTSISFLIQNLSKFPEDTDSTYNCLKLLGTRNAYLVGAIAFNLFEIHPFVETIEPLLTDSSHIGLLVVACNASSEYPPLLSILPPFYQSHLQFLRNTFPQYITCIARPSDESKLTTSGRIFACNTLDNFDLKSSDQINFAINYFSTFSAVRDKLIVKIFEYSKIFLQICKNLIIINEVIKFNKVKQSFDRPGTEKLLIQTISLCFQILVSFDVDNDNCDAARLVYLINIFCFACYTHIEGIITNFNDQFMNSLQYFSKNVTESTVLDNFDEICSQKSVYINLNNFLSSFPIIDAELKVVASHFDRDIKFHYSRLLKVKISIRAKGLQSLATTFLKIQFHDGRTVLRDLSSTPIQQENEYLFTNFKLFLSFQPSNDFGNIKFTFVKYPFRNQLISFITEHLSKSNQMIKDHSNLSKTVEIKCHPYF